MPRTITIENDDNHVNYVSNVYSTENDFNNYISGDLSGFDNYAKYAANNSYIDNMHIMLTEKNAIEFLKKKGYYVYKKVMETE